MKIRSGRACLDDATPCHCRREGERHQSSHVTIKPRHLIRSSVSRSNDSVREAHCYMTRQCGVARLVGREHGLRGECRPNGANPYPRFLGRGVYAYRVMSQGTKT
jgi:hypothetical protein